MTRNVTNAQSLDYTHEHIKNTRSAIAHLQASIWSLPNGFNKDVLLELGLMLQTVSARFANSFEINRDVYEAKKTRAS